MTCHDAARAAELTNIASSFEKEKAVGFRIGATYGYTYKTASITRESLPLLQNTATRTDLLNYYGVRRLEDLSRTETVPDLQYTQRRQTMSLHAAVGVFQAVQLMIELPLILQDTRQYDLDPNAGFNKCGGVWSCIANSSSTQLDGIYPIQPADVSRSTIFQAPTRGGTGGGGADLFDTINISLVGSPLYQKRDPTKPTWVIGFEAQVSIGTIMRYDPTRLRLPVTSALVAQSAARGFDQDSAWHGVSEGLHRFIFKTALSHRFRYVDPYLGLWYMLPVPRSERGSPWETDFGFQQKRSQPQHKAGVTFGFEAIPLENKAKGHRLSIDFRGALNVSFLGRGYSEAWELLAGSNALVCDDETALPPKFNYTDADARDGLNGNLTQGSFNPACRAPANAGPGYKGPRLNQPSPYYQQPYSGLTTIGDYVSFVGDFGIMVKLFRHIRFRAAFTYQRDQGHIITLDDAGVTGNGYPAGLDRNMANSRPMTGKPEDLCIPDRVDIKCPLDWNPVYRPVINQSGRRYRVDDVNVFGGYAMLQVYY